jgi:hypothetical protein
VLEISELRRIFGSVKGGCVENFIMRGFIPKLMICILHLIE